MTRRPSGRRAGLIAALAVVPAAAAWRFAFAYRQRAGFPRPRPPVHDPSDVGLPFEVLTIPSAEVALPAWWIPARDGAAGPAILLVHGWESARDRTLPNAQLLHAAGFHVLTIDVRGHGANLPEDLPLTAGEFGADSLAAVRALLERADVTGVGILGHSMGAVGALLAAAAEPRVGGVVAVAAPAGPYRLTRHTFRLAHLPLGNAIAYPLAWLTTRVFVRPRGHTVRGISATRAIADYAGPVLLIHGTLDAVVPTSHTDRLARIGRRARRPANRKPRDAASPAPLEPAPIDVLTIPDGHHSWLYEFPAYRAEVAAFFSRALGGPLEPEAAAAAAVATHAVRLPDHVFGFSAIEDEPGGIRTLVNVVRRPRRNQPAALPSSDPV